MEKVFTKLYIKEVVATIGNYCYKRLSVEAPKPIAYSFNGHRLPPLPPLRYPYAILTSYTYSNGEKTGYNLINSRSAWTHYGQSIFPKSACLYDEYVWTENYVDWNYREDLSAVDEAQTIIIPRGALEWTNHDIPSAPSGYWMKATDPIPVYE